MSKITNHLFILSVTVAVLAAFAPRASAQDIPRGKSVWVSLSGGAGALDGRGGGDGVRASLNYEGSEKYFISLALAGVTDSIETSVGKKEIYSSALGVLIGKRFIRPRLGFVSFSTGVSLVTGTPRTYGPNEAGLFPEDFTSIGLPLNAQIVLTPIKWLGIGLDTFANFNGGRNNFGAGFGLYVGKLW